MCNLQKYRVEHIIEIALRVPPIYKKFFPGKKLPGGRLEFPSSSEMSHLQITSDNKKMFLYTARSNGRYQNVS